VDSILGLSLLIDSKNDKHQELDSINRSKLLFRFLVAQVPAASCLSFPLLQLLIREQRDLRWFEAFL